MINHVVKNDDGSVTVRPSTVVNREGSIGVVPSDIPAESWPYLKAEEVTDSLGLKSWSFTVDLVAMTAAQEEVLEEMETQNAYSEFIKDIYDNMYEVFRTKTPETATADFETWKDMKVNPDKYAPLGLKTTHQVDDSTGTELFSPGSALDTDAKIISYASRKVEQAEAYGIYRMKRKQEYIDSKI